MGHAQDASGAAGQVSPEIDAWLRDGGLLVTASERAARAVLAAYHRARRGQGLTAWPTPNVLDWQSFVLSAWQSRNLDGRLVLSPLQERSLWARIVSLGQPGASLLEGPRYRLAHLAFEAHQLLCAYAPRFLDARLRSGWQQDAGEFSSWLLKFDEICNAQNLVSAARLPLELIALFKNESARREPLCLAGFDRKLPAQDALFSAWGEVRQADTGPPASRVAFHQAPDPASELAACSIWCRQQLAANPDARLLVVAQELAARRGELERAFLPFANPPAGVAGSGDLFEFSLGVPLALIALVRSASLLLRWFTHPLEEHEIDWLFSVDYLAGDGGELRALTAFMRAIRRKGLERTRWTLPDFLRQNPGLPLPAAWISRITQAQRRLGDAAQRTQAPFLWAELVPQVLDSAGWPGARPLTSAEFQVHRRWHQCLDDCASLGIDGQAVSWTRFMADLDRALSETLFAPESRGAPIQIAGPAESAGLTADAIWFLGACEDAWPPRGATHPLLPLGLQREAGMPHASPQVDWDLASATTRRLLASAREVNFSYARQVEGAQMRPSRIIPPLSCRPAPLPAELALPHRPDPLTVPFEDASRLPYPLRQVSGGSAVLTTQSQCPFKAFATARLDARSWDAAEAGLTASERGLLLHEVLHSIWAGPPRGIRSHAELLALPDLAAFVQEHVRRIVPLKMPERARQSMPPRYLQLEQTRLIGLITQWLTYESTRVPFTVAETEFDAQPSVAGLDLKVRLDRIDRLIDNSLLVVDYKTGMVSAESWDLPRPDDVQLPLYADFALREGTGDLGGLAFAQIRAGNRHQFLGRVKDAAATLIGGINARNALVKNPLTEDQARDWRDYIEKLARDFLSGHAEVDPRDYPSTCKDCDLKALCRIQENPLQSDTECGDDQEEQEEVDA